MELVDLLNPPADLQEPTHLSVERYLSPDYQLVVDDVDEEGVNARVDFPPMAQLDQPAEKAKEASLVRQRKGGAAAYPDRDLRSIDVNMKDLNALVN